MRIAAVILAAALAGCQAYPPTYVEQPTAAQMRDQARMARIAALKAQIPAVSSYTPPPAPCNSNVGGSRLCPQDVPDDGGAALHAAAERQRQADAKLIRETKVIDPYHGDPDWKKRAQYPVEDVTPPTPTH